MRKGVALYVSLAAFIVAASGCGGHGHGSILPSTGTGRFHSTAAGLDYASVVLADAPTGYYHLDDIGTTAADASGHGYNGTVGASVKESEPGLIGGTDTAMTFPGATTSAGIVSVPEVHAMEATTNVSLETWLRFSTVPKTFTTAVAYGSDRAYAPYSLFFRAGGILVAQFYTSAGVLEVAAPTPLAINTVYHLVATFDGTTGHLYVNGALAASGTKTGTLTGYIPGYGLAMGDDAQLEDPEFAGTLDEVAVYAGETLTAAQVLNHYNAGTGGTVNTPTPSPSPTPTPIVSGAYNASVLSDSPSAYYHLDDTGTTAIDASGHGRNGTIGSSVTENIPGLIASSTDTADAFAGLASAAGVISVPANAALQPTTSVSIEAWLRFTSTPATFTFVTGYGSDSYYAPYGLFFRTAGQIVAQFFLTGGVLEVPSSVNLAPNTTYHVVGTFDGTTGRIYVNGAQVGSATKTGTIGDYIAGYGFSMGDDAARSDPAYKGTLDEVAVYAGKALSATQVQSHYTAGTTGGSTPPSPTPTPAGGSEDWLTMGYDIGRTGYNPSETTIGTSNVAGLHSVWSRSIGGQIGEPVYASGISVNGVATNVLYAASASGKALALNADTGAQIWSQPIGTSSYTCPNGGGTFTFGPTGTPALDLPRGRVYIPDGAAQVHAYDLSTGAEVSGWPVTIASAANFNFIEAGLTFNSATGMLYAETSSTCDIPPWNGRITEINTSTAAIVNTFFPTQGTSGGGIWGLGGASIDRTTNDVYIATGNADTSNGGSQSAFYAEQIVALSPDLATVIGHSYATLPPSSDADYGATPLLFQPPGCGPLLAAVNKSGLFVLFDRTNISAGPTQTIQMSIPTDNGDFIGVPAYDPATNHVYVGLPATEGIYKPGLGAFQMTANCTLNPTPVWNAVFGADGAVLTTDDTPRSPIAIANGVVYVDDYDNGVAYAFSAASGAQLWTTALSGKGIVGPIVVNGHLYTSDITGKITDWIP